jgi:hypothetical protein
MTICLLIHPAPGVGFDLLGHLLKSFDLELIVFGFDVLYEKPWVVMLQLWQALQRSAKIHEGALFGIVNANSGCFLW